jgi:hypothetical protein
MYTALQIPQYYIRYPVSNPVSAVKAVREAIMLDRVIIRETPLVTAQRYQWVTSGNTVVIFLQQRAYLRYHDGWNWKEGEKKLWILVVFSHQRLIDILSFFLVSKRNKIKCRIFYCSTADPRTLLSQSFFFLDMMIEKKKKKTTFSLVQICVHGHSARK